MPPVTVMYWLAVMCWQTRQVTSGGNRPSGMSAQGPDAPHKAMPGRRVMNPTLTAWSAIA